MTGWGCRACWYGWCLGQLPGELGPGPKPGTGLREPAGLATWVGHPVGGGCCFSALIFGAGTSEVQSQDLWGWRPHLRCWGSGEMSVQRLTLRGRPGRRAGAGPGEQPRPPQGLPERLAQGHACPPAWALGLPPRLLIWETQVPGLPGLPPSPRSGLLSSHFLSLTSTSEELATCLDCFQTSCKF